MIAHRLDPRAVLVMKEAGVDISHHTSKEVGSMMNISFDYVITVCSHADEHCPTFSDKAQVVHVGFDNPPSLTTSAQNEEEVLSHFRCVRDKIRTFIETLPPK